MTQNNSESYIASWMMTKVCNFDCFYCGGNIKGTIKNLLDVKAISKTLSATGKEWTVAMTGGEPFLYPNFIDLCVELTKSHKIAIDTNLSTPKKVIEFSEVILPERVSYLYVSTHIEERESVDGVESFIESYRILDSKGFNLCVNYVLHPKLIDRFNRDFEFLKSHGIEVKPKPFVGAYEGKKYPDSYSLNAMQILKNHNERASAQMPFYSKGLLCNAGKNLMRIEPDGKVTRCTGDRSVIGNIYTGVSIYEKPQPCNSERCTCFGTDLLAAPKYSPFQLFVKKLFAKISG